MWREWREFPIVLAIGMLGACGEESAPSPPVPAQSVAEADDPLTDPVRAEVIVNIQTQPLGPGTVADLALPAPLLGRIADRVLRESYIESIHRFASSAAFAAPSAVVPPEEEQGGYAEARRVDLPAPDDTLGTGRPGARGFIAPRPGAPGPAPLSPTAGEAARTVAARLAPDGLLATLGAIVGGRDEEAAALETELWAAGFPVDLLAFVEGAEEPGVSGVIRQVVARGTTGLRIAVRPTDPRFRASVESGREIVACRMQLTRATDWRGVGDGGSLDMLRQLAGHGRMIDLDLCASAEFVPALQRRLRAWRPGGGVTIIAAPVVVSQWAQDDAKPGWIGEDRAILLPRYASRRDDGSEFVPGDAWITGGLDAAGCAVVHSPLLFQGGNLLVVKGPGADGGRWLFAGEAEIARNVALGLTYDEVIAAFAAEFGVECVEVIANVAFHLDYDLTLRHDGRDLIAFVNDPVAAAEIIVGLGAETLVALETLSPEEGRRVAQALASHDAAAMVRTVRPGLPLLRTPDGALRADVAPSFAGGPVDTGAGNLQRFMVAIDVLMSVSRRSPGEHPQVVAYDAAHRRAIDGLDAIAARLTEIGCRVVRVPGLTDGRFGVCPVNGIHDGPRFLMPVWGGWLSPLDEAAAEVFRRELPGVEIVPIRSAESQQRGGAVHCAVSAWSASR